MASGSAASVRPVIGSRRPGVASVAAKTAEELAAGAVLIRPDGYLCWTAPPGPLTAADLTRLHAAADRWCPRP